MALKGGPLPMGLLFQAVQRSRAEQAVTRNRAALIKMVLLSQQPSLSPEEDIMVQLDAREPEILRICAEGCWRYWKQCSGQPFLVPTPRLPIASSERHQLRQHRFLVRYSGVLVPISASFAKKDAALLRH